MRKFLIAVAVAAPLGLSLPGCAVLAPLESPAVACFSALLASGSFDPVVLGGIVLANSSCQSLAASVVADIITQVTGANTQLAAAKADAAHAHELLRQRHQ